MAIVMIPLLIVIGVPAVGFGWLASGLGEAIVLIRSARKYSEFTIGRRLIPPTVFAAIAAVLGWGVAAEIGATTVGGLAGGLAAAVYLLALWIWYRSYILDSFRLSSRGLRDVVRRPA